MEKNNDRGDKRVHVLIPEPLLTLLDKEAKDNSLNRSEFIRRVLIHYLNQNTERDKKREEEIAGEIRRIFGDSDPNFQENNPHPRYFLQ